MLEDIAIERLILVPGRLNPGDCLLWPMLDASAAMLATRPVLTRWTNAMAAQDAAICTRADLTILTGDPQ